MKSQDHKSQDHKSQDHEPNEDISFKSPKRKKKAEKYDITHQNNPYLKSLNKESPSLKQPLSNKRKKSSLKIPTIDIIPPKWQQIIFSPFSFNYHCTHHLFMGVPHYNLKKLHQLLREEEHPDFFFREKSYLKSLQEILDYEQLNVQKESLP